MLVKFSIAMIVCADVVRSKAFYRDVLALTPRAESAEWVDFDLGDGSTLGLHPASPDLPVRPGSLQLGFEVDNVDRFVTDAKSLGVRVYQEPYDDRVGRFAVIADPDGYAIQVITKKK